MKEKIEKIEQLNSDLKYLRDEYSQIVLFGSAPNGDVTFDSLMKWLAENEHTADYMINVAKQLNFVKVLGGEG